MDYAARVDASAVLRGIRALSDYEYELQMALMNRKLQPELETVFMMPAEKYSYLSSRLVREVAQLGGSVKGLVPELVEQQLRDKLDPGVQASRVQTPKAKDRKAGNRGQGKKHDTHDHGSDPGHQTYRTHQPHRALRHHGGGGRSRQAAPAGH